MDPFDNSKPIPEPMLTKVENWIDSKEEYVTAIDCVQYGYNLAMVQVNCLEISMKAKDELIERLKNQIK